ncbi:hypothetical protein KP509_11G060000 [Ceratopteris richardii]|uniref:Uncharacterized protein n=1 Tax=Ceratopteris richardii TaxID=49495 RepID=A0A8T2TTD3_CERRI|nr:hypothetical protein KP509_11G059900 [Ceratopteris richardii]KAH7425550.1 hypothetical protein KP509_11G060000 [Ceratopteris richardii]
MSLNVLMLTSCICNPLLLMIWIITNKLATTSKNTMSGYNYEPNSYRTSSTLVFTNRQLGDALYESPKELSILKIFFLIVTVRDRELQEENEQCSGNQGLTSSPAIGIGKRDDGSSCHHQ